MKRHASKVSPVGRWRRVAWLVVLVAGLGLALAIRLHRLDFPFERDEGEYAYAGRLILDGVAPYTEIHNMKLPGTYYAYALLMALFGQTDSGVHLGLALWATGSALLVFAIGSCLFGRFAGALAAATFAMLAVSPGVLGLAGHATHFLLLPVLAGFWLLVRPGRLSLASTLLAGLAFGAAFLMKQHAVTFLVFGAAVVGLRERSRGLGRLLRAEATFLAGAVFPYGALCAYLFSIGAFEDFWFWTVTYASHYVTQLSVSSGIRSFLRFSRMAVGWNAAVWTIAAAGAWRILRSRSMREPASQLLMFSGFSFAAVVPGFYFRPHYFIAMLPAVALLASAGAAEEKGEGRCGSRRISIFAVALLVGVAVWAYGYSGQFFTWDPVRLARESYGTNPVVEAREIGRRLARGASSGDRIAVLGSEPQIPFYAGMRSAGSHAYVYALVEVHEHAARLQEDAIREIEAGNPEHVVFVRVGTSWGVRPRSHRRILDWIDEWVPSRYAVVGIVEIPPGRPALYTWGLEAASRRVESEDYILVLRRRGSGPAPPPAGDRRP